MIEIELLNPVIKDDTPIYDGPVNVVPSTESQTLETAGKKLESNVTIAATPLESKTLNISENGQYSVTPDEGYNGLSEVNIRVNTPVIPSYSISVTITNGTYSGATTIVAGQTASLTLSASEGFILPAQADIEVSGAAIDSYNQSTGQLVLKWGIFNVTVNTSCASAYPSKGDIISIDMNGDGTDEQYLVLKNMGGSIVECLSRVPRGNRFALSGNVYENSSLDVDMNTTYYDTLSEEAKLAIVDKTFYQEEWAKGTVGTVVYTGVVTSSGSTYQLSLVNSNYGNQLIRHIYVPSISDILDFLGTTVEMTAANTTLRSENLTVFRDDGRPVMWLSSKRNNSGDVFIVSTPSNTSSSQISDLSANSFTGYSTLPAFQIDLSKIPYLIFE